ncbi:MAG: flagellar hook-associated protein FlgL [Deltaproteobacteria bacterium]|nr:flagellar hook-associated protein FlgL [Deltaproteobacteria bacterium]
MRVTDTMRYNTAISNIFNAQAQYNDISEKLASQKNINRASDDPVAATKLIEIRRDKAANEQYKKNMDSTNSWITATESNLFGAYDLLVKAQEIAVGQSTATASETTRKIMAESVKSLIGEMGRLANAKMGYRYLFSGTRDDVAPFSTVAMDATIEAAAAAANNSFQGTVVSSGTFTGSTNKTYVVKITDVTTIGEFLGQAEYQSSADGGKTWSAAATLPAGGSVDLGEGVTLTFDDLGATAGFGENDIFYVNAVAPGYYRGNDGTLSMPISRGAIVDYNITGSEAFTAAGSNGVDIFKTLNDLKDALSSNNAQGISAQIDNLKNAQNQVTLNQSLSGSKANYIEVAKNNLEEVDMQLNSLLSQTQDADLADLSTKLAMKEIALQASYAIASKIGNTTILDILE